MLVLDHVSEPQKAPYAQHEKDIRPPTPESVVKRLKDYVAILWVLHSDKDMEENVLAALHPGIHAIEAAVEALADGYNPLKVGDWICRQTDLLHYLAHCEELEDFPYETRALISVVDAIDLEVETFAPGSRGMRT